MTFEFAKCLTILSDGETVARCKLQMLNLQIKGESHTEDVECHPEEQKLELYVKFPDSRDQMATLLDYKVCLFRTGKSLTIHASSLRSGGNPGLKHVNVSRSLFS